MSVAYTASAPKGGSIPHSFLRRLVPLALCLTSGFVAPILAQDDDEEDATNDAFGIQAPISDQDGHPTFASPHFNPLSTSQRSRLCGQHTG